MFKYFLNLLYYKNNFQNNSTAPPIIKIRLMKIWENAMKSWLQNKSFRITTFLSTCTLLDLINSYRLELISSTLTLCISFISQSTLQLLKGKRPFIIYDCIPCPAQCVSHSKQNMWISRKQHDDLNMKKSIKKQSLSFNYILHL